MRAGSTIPHAVFRSAESMSLAFSGGVRAVLGWYAIESDAIQAWMTALLLQWQGPSWIERAQCTPSENGCPDQLIPLCGAPRLATAWFMVATHQSAAEYFGTDQGNVLHVELKLEMIDLKPFECVMEGDQGSDSKQMAKQIAKQRTLIRARQWCLWRVGKKTGSGASW